MEQGGFFERRSVSPTSLVVVIAMHGAALTALALSKMEMPELKVFTPTIVRNIPELPDPPPVEREPVKPEVETRHETVIETFPPLVPIEPLDRLVVSEPQPPKPIPFDPLPPIKEPVRAQEQPAPPVRVAAALDPRSELQPPYPASEQRAGAEGVVRIRVLIGADGRVKTTEKVSAPSDAFYRATERQALRHWRFKPATVDGKPVESRLVMTVEFRLA